MNRRHFLKASGLSLGSLLISNRLCGSASYAATQSKINLPDQVQVLSDQGRLMLSVVGNSFVNGDIQVSVKEKEQALNVFLASPSRNIRSVEFTWFIPRSLSTICLGDHWERGYGDLQWSTVNKTRIMPWYFMEYDGIKCNGFGVKTAPSAFCCWQTSETELKLVMDVRSGGKGVALGTRELSIASIVTYQGEEGERPFSATRNFCKIMCEQPRLPAKPVYGINDWYFAYGNNSDKLIMETVNMLHDLAENPSNRPFCLIDAGWAILAPGDTYAGCWADNYYTPNANFKDMGNLALDIREKGMRPGLWMRPLCASHSTPVNRLMPEINRSDSPHRTFLDPTIPENLEYVEKCFRQYQEWGYEMIKHDFTTVDMLGRWGFEMIEKQSMSEEGWQFYDNTRTNAEIILNLYRTIRKSAGDIYLIGCNTVSHLSAGLFELQRTGDDTSGKEWQRTLKMGVNTVAFRAPQHNTFYASDGDCVGLTTEVDWRLNKQWMQLLAESGTPLFISAQPDAVGPEQKEWIRKCFRTASSELPVGEPLDWLETLTPLHWMLNREEKKFQWV